MFLKMLVMCPVAVSIDKRSAYRTIGNRYIGNEETRLERRLKQIFPALHEILIVLIKPGIDVANLHGSPSSI